MWSRSFSERLSKLCLNRGVSTQPALQMNRTNSSVQALAMHHDRDGQLARTLGDGNNVDLLPGNCGEDAPCEAGRSAHAFAHYSDQPDVRIHIDWLEISMRQLERET